MRTHLIDLCAVIRHRAGRRGRRPLRDGDAPSCRPPFVRVILSVAEIRAKRGSNGENAVWDLGRKEKPKRLAGGASGTSVPTRITVCPRTAHLVHAHQGSPRGGRLQDSRPAGVQQNFFFGLTNAAFLATIGATLQKRRALWTDGIGSS